MLALFVKVSTMYRPQLFVRNPFAKPQYSADRSFTVRFRTSDTI